MKNVVDGGNLAPPEVPKVLGRTVVLGPIGGARFHPSAVGFLIVVIFEKFLHSSPDKLCQDHRYISGKFTWHHAGLQT